MNVNCKSRRIMMLLKLISRRIYQIMVGLERVCIYITSMEVRLRCNRGIVGCKISRYRLRKARIGINNFRFSEKSINMTKWKKFKMLEQLPTQPYQTSLLEKAKIFAHLNWEPNFFCVRWTESVKKVRKHLSKKILMSKKMKKTRITIHLLDLLFY